MKKVIYLLLLLAISSNLFAQDPAFSQNYANPLYLNPAFAGTSNNQRIGMNFRDQWPNIPGTIVTYNISYDRNIIDSSFGIGILANQDRAGQGTMITDNISLIESYQFHIKSFTLSLGIEGTWHYKSFNYSNLTFGYQIDPTRGFIYNNNETPLRTYVSVPDFSAGILGYGKYYFAGFAMNHLTQPDESFATGASPLPIRYTFNAGGMIPIGGFTISPTYIHTQQQDFTEDVVELYAIKWNVTLGIGYRFQDAMIFTLGYQRKWLRIGYSYDYTTSSLGNATGGSQEASLAILLHYKSPKLVKVSGINCPAF
ncbi:MAG TPA: PorP/SprF family type IX secretion system membrane protein [Bacteroidia bacterium]|jgi:type IX secretion system PorP/SprF family membrane protein|nr:PorP/SprF family type IX secretion system membrane protein [Bacteroidia bacterium]